MIEEVVTEQVQTMYCSNCIAVSRNNFYDLVIKTVLKESIGVVTLHDIAWIRLICFISSITSAKSFVEIHEGLKRYIAKNSNIHVVRALMRL